MDRLGTPPGVTRRRLLAGAAGAAAAVALEAPASAAAPTALWDTAWRRGLLFGSSAATWQFADRRYAALHAREAALLLTEDDLLWYRVRPTPTSALIFDRPDRIVAAAEADGQLVLGAHLVWDQGFGRGWPHQLLWHLHRDRARTLLFGTVRDLVGRYRSRVAVWSCANEVIAADARTSDRGLRTDVPWYQTCGRDYVATAFHVAHDADPAGTLLLNDFGYETRTAGGPDPAAKQRVTLDLLDQLLADGVPVHGFGLQAHLDADGFAERFNARGYQRFVHELTARGLRVLITELDVLDDGLPADPRIRDRGVADVYRRYLDTVLGSTDVSAVLTFGLSDRYTWLQEDDPRRDGAARRPLPFDGRLRPVAAFGAVQDALAGATRRPPWLRPPRAGRSPAAR